MIFIKTLQKLLKQDLTVETRQFLKGKFIGLMKDELGGKITTECVALRAKTFIY